MPAHAVLASIDLVPVARAVADAVVPLSAEARAWPILVMYEDQTNAVLAALDGLPVLDPYEDGAFSDLPAPKANDLRGVASVVGHVLTAPPEAGIYQTEIAYPYVVFRLVASSPSVVREHLERAGLSVTAFEDLPVPEVESAEVAIQRAMEACKEAIPGKLADELRGFLQQETPPTAALVSARGKDKYDDDVPLSDLVSNGLTGAVERWNTKVSGRLLDLWLATRNGDWLGTDGTLHLGLGEEGLGPELGFDRAQVVADALVARGVSRPLATVLAGTVSGESSTWLGVRLLAEPEHFSVEKHGLPVVRAALAAAIPPLGLRTAPSVRARVFSLLAEHSPAFGIAALKSLLSYDDDGSYARAVDESHVATAASDATLADLLELVTKVEETRGGKKPKAGKATKAAKGAKGTLAPSMRTGALLAWANCVSPSAFLDGVGRAIESCGKGAVDLDAFWEHLAEVFSAKPNDPLGLGDSPPFCLYFTSSLRSPTGAAQETLLAWCKEHPEGFGAYTKTFLKTVTGKKK